MEFPRNDVEARLLSSIQSDPRDDALRAVYADWLDEHGDADLAELLRLGLELRTGGTKELRERYQALRSTAPPAWRRLVSRPLRETEFEASGLDAAVARIEQSAVPRVDIIVKRLREHVESLGVDDGDPYGTVRVYDGDLAMSTDFLISMSPVVVLGDLDVTAQVTDLIEADQSLLVVAGSLRCKTIWQLGDMVVAGDVVCDIFYGASHSDHRTEVLGDVTVDVIFENGHHFVIGGALAARVRLGESISVSGRYFEDEGDHAMLLPTVLDDDGDLDEEALYQRICAGEPIVSAGTRA